jgi:hypothetical protein
MSSAMERIDPQGDHEALKKFQPGASVSFRGKTYKIQGRTTLASGEAAVVLQNEQEQFVISAARFLAGVQA